MSSHGLLHRVGYGVFVIGILVFLVSCFRGYRDTALRGIDFKIVYSSSRCLLDRCDPYNYKVLFQEYANAGGDVSSGIKVGAFKAYPALYPPSSIFWVAPFTLLPYNSALTLWLTCSALLFTIAALLLADLCRRFSSPLPLILLGMFVATSTNLVTTGQPSSFAISLCVIGVWSLLSNRMPALGIACFALSLTLKPQIAGLILIYFLFAPGPARRRAVQILVTTALFCVPGIVWATTIPAAAHWPESIRANLAGSAKPGSINDPGPTSFNAMSVTDLQSVFAVFDDVPAVYNLESQAVAGLLMLAWAYIAFRASPSQKKDFLGVATIACLSLLPIYHRHYDVRLLILAFPAVASMVAAGGLEAIAGVVVPTAVICLSHPTFIRDHLALHQETLGPLKTILLMRTAPLAVLFSGIVFLIYFARTLKAGGKPSPQAEG